MQKYAIIATGLLGLLAISAGLVMQNIGGSSIEDCISATAFVGVGDCGSGSGVWVGPHCLLTAKHIADSNDPLWVVDINGDRSYVTKRILDEDDDMALLIVDGTAPNWIKLGMNPSPGDTVYIIGAPFGFSNYPTITAGVLSRTKDYLDDFWASIIVVDAVAAPGNSGGPVISNGRLVGICAGIYRQWPMTICEPIADLDDEIMDIISN